MAHDYYIPGGRRDRNLASRSWAHRDKERWLPEEDDLITVEWVYTDPDVRDEEGVSRVLERTIESCRVRAEYLRKELGLDTPRRPVAVKRSRTTTTTTTEVRYIGAMDDDEDRWWDPAK